MSSSLTRSPTLAVGIHLVRLVERELDRGVLDLVDDLHGAEGADAPGLGIDLDEDVLVARGSAPVGGLDRVRERA